MLRRLIQRPEQNKYLVCWRIRKHLQVVRRILIVTGDENGHKLRQERL